MNQARIPTLSQTKFILKHFIFELKPTTKFDLDNENGKIWKKFTQVCSVSVLGEKIMGIRITEIKNTPSISIPP